MAKDAEEKRKKEDEAMKEAEEEKEPAEEAAPAEERVTITINGEEVDITGK